MTTYFDIIMIPLQLLIVFFTIIILRFRSSGWFTAKKTKRFMKKSILLPWLSARITKNALSALW